MVSGEIYCVDDCMLEKLDELEGIAEGRYTRTTIIVTTESGRNIECFVYSLRSLPKGINKTKLQPMPEYDLGGHLENYVPPGPRRESSRLERWGGYGIPDALETQQKSGEERGLGRYHE